MPCPYSGKECHGGIGAPSFDPFIVGRCTKLQSHEGQNGTVPDQCQLCVFVTFVANLLRTPHPFATFAPEFTPSRPTASGR